MSNQQLITYQRNKNRTNKQAGVFYYSEDSQRLRDLEVKGEDEYNAELRLRVIIEQRIWTIWIKLIFK